MHYVSYWTECMMVTENTVVADCQIYLVDGAETLLFGH
jgi:hypothetical protein